MSLIEIGLWGCAALLVGSIVCWLILSTLNNSRGDAE